MSLATCPKCGCQLEVKLTFASGPKASASTEGIGSLLDEAEGRRDELNAWETEFVGKLRERYDQYGSRVRMSDKQMAILQKIAAGE